MNEIAKDQSDPRIKQQSIFLPNRVGMLQRVVTTLERENVGICGINILDAADHAVVRMVVNRPETAREHLDMTGYTVFETRLVGVALPEEEEHGVRKVLTALLGAEVNIFYVYPLIVQVNGCSVLVLHAEDLTLAARVMRGAGFSLVDQDDIG
ncbi:MAG: hypothetical protein ACYSUN_08850 [Planctomycetota bacterium]|jgi:hypothetical protein